MTKTKNQFIELLRILFIVILLVHHDGIFAPAGHRTFFINGYLAVEFFFMLSGYFTAKHIERTKEMTPEQLRNPMEYSMKYTFQKLFRIFPYAIIGILLTYTLGFLRPATGPDTSLIDRLLMLRNLPFECTFLPMTGVMRTDPMHYMNAPLWYLSALFIALPIISYLAIKCRDAFKWWMCLFLPALLYAYIVACAGGIGSFNVYTGFLFGGVLRAFAGMIMGFGLAYLSDFLSKRKPSALVKVLLTVLEVGLLLYIVYCCHIIMTQYDAVFVVYCIAAMLLLHFSECTYTSKLRVPGLNYLGSLTTPMYCIHYGIGVSVSLICTGISFYGCLAVYFALTLAVSAILKLLIKK